MAQNHIQEFRALLQKISDYDSAIALLSWDSRTKLPKKGVEGRAQVLSTLAGERFRLLLGEPMEQILEALADSESSLDEVTRRSFWRMRKQLERIKRVSIDRLEAFARLTSKAEAVWVDAREANDFASFAPYLTEIVEMKREFIAYRDWKGPAYDALLDEYEPDLTMATLDPLFAKLRGETLRLLDQIREAKQPDTSILERFYDPQKQRAFSLTILEKIGYDLQAGRLDETAHPFQTTISLGDARVTTRYLPYFFNSAIFGTIHEGGHALYEQGVDPALFGTPLFGGTSMGIHESQSRFFENILGRSMPFWERFYGDLQVVFPDALGDTTRDAFYAAINAVKPSLIRVEADELTYNLHIMVRYEIEKALISGDARVTDLPELWNAQMKEYLGVVPDSDANGVLQDVHWSGGDFGYFPSYALGNLYSAQFAEKLEEEMPNLWDDVRRGELMPIREWFRERIHRFGGLREPGELVQDITGQPLKADALIRYFEKKYVPLYRLS